MPLNIPCKGMWSDPIQADVRFVHVQVSYGANEAILTVKDSGVGIPCMSYFYRNDDH